MLTNLPKRDDVLWMKHTISRLNTKHVEDAKDVLEYLEAHLQSESQTVNRIVQSWWPVEGVLRYTHIPTPLDDSTRPLVNSTNSTVHNPQELALW